MLWIPKIQSIVALSTLEEDVMGVVGLTRDELET
jgi:hypothetical protein